MLSLRLWYLLNFASSWTLMSLDQMLALRHDIAHGEWAPLMAAEIHMVEKWWV
jgi:HAMP domain-containing protein